MCPVREALEHACERCSCYGCACDHGNACFRHRKSGGGGVMLIRDGYAVAPSETPLVAAGETLSRNAILLAVTQLSRVRPAKTAGLKNKAQ